MNTMGLYRPNELSLCYLKGMFHHFFVGDRMRFHGLFEEHIGTLFGKQAPARQRHAPHRRCYDEGQP